MQVFFEKNSVFWNNENCLTICARGGVKSRRNVWVKPIQKSASGQAGKGERAGKNSREAFRQSASHSGMELPETMSLFTYTR